MDITPSPSWASRTGRTSGASELSGSAAGSSTTSSRRTFFLRGSARRGAPGPSSTKPRATATTQEPAIAFARSAARGDSSWCSSTASGGSSYAPDATRPGRTRLTPSRSWRTSSCRGNSRRRHGGHAWISAKSACAHRGPKATYNDTGRGRASSRFENNYHNN